jgi:hypothetical protein
LIVGGRKLRFTRSASAWRARGASECRRHVQLQRARQRPAHPNGPALSELSTVARTLALERKRPVKNRRCRRCRTGVDASPQIRQRPHANCASHACPSQALRIYIYMSTPGEPGHTHGTHTGAHGHTDARITASHRRTSQPSLNHPNPPTLHQRTQTHCDRNRQQPHPCFRITAVLVPEVSLFRQARG